MRKFLLLLLSILPSITFAQVTFADSTANLEIPAIRSGSPLAVVDMNNDGLDDIVCLDSLHLLYIHYQSPDTAAFNTEFITGLGGDKWSICVADADGNGHNDIFTGGENDSLYLVSASNDGSTYTSSIVTAPSIFLQGSNFVDIDNDGDSDVFACNNDGLSLPLANDGTGTLSPALNLLDPSSTIPSDNSGNLGSVWTDYDNDGDLDLYISKGSPDVDDPGDGRRLNLLFRNDGNGFVEVAGQANLQPMGQSRAADFADIDNDGDLDCFIINNDINNSLHLNLGDGNFIDITLASNLLSALNGIGPGVNAKFADFDNDGFVDLLYTSLGADHALLLNNGNNTFTKATDPFPGAPTRIQSAAIGDLDNDGFLDVYASFGFNYFQSSNEIDRLFLNDGNSNHYFKTRIKGVASNSNGIGARLELYGSWGKQIREIRSGEGYGVMNSYTAHFGLGAATTVDSLIIRWPSGNVDFLTNPPADTTLFIEEGDFCLPNSGFQFSRTSRTVDFLGGGDAGVLDWRWDFGDGQTGNGQQVTHIYPDDGTYTVCLTTNGSCGQAEFCTDITVSCFTPLSDFIYATDGLDISFENLSVGDPTSWLWEFGDGATSTEENPNYGFDTTGVYVVCLTSFNDCGSSSVCEFVQGSCGNVTTAYDFDAGGLSVQFIDYSSAGTNSWQWDFGDGTSSTEQNPFHDFPMTGTYQVCLNIDGVCGSGQFCQTIEVSCPPPVAQFTTLSDELNILFRDTSTNEPTAWLWDFGDGDTSTQELPLHTYAVPGTYTACLLASSPCGQDSICQEIIVTCDAPEAGFSYTQNELTLTFTDTSTNQPTAWLWVVEGQDSLTGPSFEYTFDSAATYEICLQASSICGMTETCQMVTASCASLEPGFIVQADALRTFFTDTSSATATAWLWDFGDGNVSYMQNPVHDYAMPGSYEACLTIANTCGDSIRTCQPLSLSCAAPEAGFSYQSGMLSLSLSDTSSNSPSQWLWSFGDGNSSAQQNPQHTYSAPGTYEVCLTSSSVCGSSQACSMVVITCAEPVAGFIWQQNGLAVSLTDTTANMPAQWVWTFGDGENSTLQNPQHSFAAPGTYVVCLLASSVCGTDQACRQVTVSCAAPQANFGFQADELSLSFTDQSADNPTDWIWDFGDGTTDSQANPQHTYTLPGNYQVCLQASSVCGSTETCQMIEVSCAAPEPAFSVQATELSLSFTDETANGPESWLWTFGDGTSSTLANPQHTYAVPGSYQVCLQASSLCGDNTICQAVEVGCAAPQSSFTYSADALAVSFTDNSMPGASQWSWAFGDGGSSSEPNPQYTYSAPGTYTACLEAATLCGSTQSCQTFTLSCIPPIAGFTFADNQLAVSFSDQSANTPTEWLWDFGDGTVSTQANPQHTYSLPGDYEVCLTASSVCGMTQVCQPLTVNCLAPQANFAYSGEELTFSFIDTSSNNPATWLWVFGDGNNSAEQNPTHTFEFPGSYLVCLSVSSPCGNTQRCELIEVSCTPPQAGFSYQVDGQVLSLQDTSSDDAIAWLWDFGDGTSSTQPNPQHLYNQPGAYEVCLTVSNICGSTQSCATILVNCQPPVADFVFSLQGLTASFIDVSSNTPDQWQWSFGDGNTATLPEPLHAFEFPDIYTVCLTASNSCGSDTICREIEIMTTSLDAPSEKEVQVMVYPNPGTGPAYLRVDATGPQDYQWALYNSLGQRMQVGQGKAGEVLPLDFAPYSSGVYWVQVRMGAYRGVVKVVRE